MQELKWIPVSEFMQEALKFGMQNPNLSALTAAAGDKAIWQSSDQILYHIFLVKSFAFQLSQYINLQQKGP